MIFVTKHNQIFSTLFHFFVQENNKQHVVQSLVLNDVWIKRKTSHDHIREWSEANNALCIMQENQVVCKKLLVYTDSFNGATPLNFLKEVAFWNFPKQEKVLLKIFTGSGDFTPLKTKKMTDRRVFFNYIFQLMQWRLRLRRWPKSSSITEWIKIQLKQWYINFKIVFYLNLYKKVSFFFLLLG